MKKLVVLVQEYLEINKETVSKKELEAAQKKLFDKSIKTFKEQMKELYAAHAFTILKEVPPESVLIEYDKVMDDKMWDALRAADIVSIVDSNVPTDI